MSVENTFSNHLMTLSEVQSNLKSITKELFRRYQLQSNRSKTISLKIKYGNFKQVSRSKSQKKSIVNFSEIQVLIESLLSQDLLHEAGIRLLGLSLSNFEPKKDRQTQMTIDF